MVVLLSQLLREPNPSWEPAVSSLIQSDLSGAGRLPFVSYTHVSFSGWTLGKPDSMARYFKAKFSSPL